VPASEERERAHRRYVPETLPASHLSVHACWALLRGSSLGRLAVVVDGAPDIFPVNHAVDHGALVLRTAEGRKLAAATAGPVAFEVDGVDESSGEAWSVVVRGRAVRLRRPDELLDTVDLDLHPWHGAPKPAFLRIEPDEVTGRRFVPAVAGRWDLPQAGAPATSPE